MINKITEEGDHKNEDTGHSPWKLVNNTGKEAVIEVSTSKTPVKRVYLKRLIRQDSTGIWTVVGYDPK